MLYVVYGEKVPGGYEVYDSYILACRKYKKLKLRTRKTSRMP